MYRILVPLACAALFASPALAQGLDAGPINALAGNHPATHAGSGGAAVPALTLDAALQAALSHSRILRAAAFEVEANDGAVHQARALPNPALGIEQEDTRRETRSTTVQLSQLIELGGKRAARVALADKGRDVALAELDQRRAEVRSATIQTFFDALVAQERVAVAEESQRIATGAADATARRVAAGKVSPTEETRARVADANMRIELRQAQAARRSAFAQLATVMGSDDLTAAIALLLDGRAEALPPPPSSEAIQQRLERSPALRRAQLEVQRAQANYDLEHARRTPDLTVSIGSKRNEELRRTQPVIGLSISLPLFDRNQGAQMAALRHRDAAESRALAEAQRVRAEVLQASEQLQAGLDEVALLQSSVLPGARSAFETTSRGFELGKFGFLDVLDAQRTWLQARSQHLSALAQAHRAAADLERLLGAPQH